MLFKNLISRSHFIVIFLSFYLLISFFYQYPTANSIPRIAHAIRIVENHAYDLGDYHKLTIDKSFVNNKYYNDKAPLSTLILVPVLALDNIIHNNSDAPELKLLHANYLSLKFVNYPIYALFCAVLFFSLINARVPFTTAFLLTAAGSFGTYLSPMASNFFGHHIAALLLFFSYFFFQRGDRISFIKCGLLLGFAFSAEYTAYLFGISAVILLLFNKKLKSITDIAIIFTGALPGIFIVLLNNLLSTGNIFYFPYQFEVTEQFQAMQSNFGFRLPSGKAVWELLFGQYRGMIFYAPFLAVGIPALIIRTYRDESQRSLPILLGCIWILFVSMFFLWWGGSSYGPRYLIPISFIIFFEAIHAIVYCKIVRPAVFLGAIGIFFATSTQCITAIISEDIRYPIFDFILPALLNGRGPLWGENWGTHIGLGPVGSLTAWFSLFLLIMFLSRFICLRTMNITQTVTK